MGLLYENILTEVGVNNGLLSKINIGGKVYELKDAVAREALNDLRTAAQKDYVEAISESADLPTAAAVKAYVDAQVGSINKFDVHVLTDGQELPTASADTMYILYLKPETDAASGAYVEYITVKSGNEYTWEAIGSTKMDVTGFVTEEALADALKPYAKSADLGDLAAKDSASGTVAGETISGIKARGQSAGSINVALESTEKDVASAGKYTPAGNVTGTVTPSGTVAVTVSTSATDATLTKGDYTPAGDVSVALSGGSFNQITGVGTQASFTEGTFTPATLQYNAVEKNVATEGIVGAVEDETLTFTAAGVEAISASKITSFSGGSKDADTFVANSLPTMAAHEVGVQSASFTGTLAEDIVVTGVSYAKANANATATFTGDVNDISAAFAGTEGDISVSGKCHDYAVKTAEFVPAAIELTVGDIVVADKQVVVE